MTPFDLRVGEQGGTTTVSLAGELDLTTVPEVEAALAKATIGERLVVDVRELSFIDSSGVRLLMVLDLRSREQGWLFLLARRPDGPVQKVLELCGFEDRVATSD